MGFNQIRLRYFSLSKVKFHTSHLRRFLYRGRKKADFNIRTQRIVLSRVKRIPVAFFLRTVRLVYS